jgi:hypothetical protein
MQNRIFAQLSFFELNLLPPNFATAGSIETISHQSINDATIPRYRSKQLMERKEKKE